MWLLTTVVYVCRVDNIQIKIAKILYISGDEQIGSILKQKQK